MRHFLPAQALLGHQDRPVAVSHARAAGQQRILRTDVSVGVNADGGDVQFAPRGPFVQGLDVLQHVRELELARRNQFLGQPIKHEGIIGVR